MNGLHSSQKRSSESSSNDWFNTRSMSNNSDTELDESRSHASKPQHRLPCRGHTNGDRRIPDNVVLQSAKPPPTETGENIFMSRFGQVQNGAHNYHGRQSKSNGQFEHGRESEGRSNGHFAHAQTLRTELGYLRGHTPSEMLVSENNFVSTEQGSHNESPFGMEVLHDVLTNDQSRELESYNSQHTQQPRTDKAVIPTFESLFSNTEQSGSDRNTQGGGNKPGDKVKRNRYEQASEDPSFDISPWEERLEDPFMWFNAENSSYQNSSKQPPSKRPQWNTPQIRPEQTHSSENSQTRTETSNQKPHQSTHQSTHQHRQRPFVVNSPSTAKDLMNLSEFVEPRGDTVGMYGSANPWARRMYSKENRLSTFVVWPKEHIVSAESLAEFGWFYTGPDDRVECPHCCGAVYNWVKGDTALGEHKRHFPNCSFIKEKLKAMLEHVPVETSPRRTYEQSPRPSAQPSLSTAIEIVKELGYSHEQIDRALDDLSGRDKVISSQNILDAIFEFQAHQDMRSTPERETAHVQRHNDVRFHLNDSHRDQHSQNLPTFSPARREPVISGEKSAPVSTEEGILTQREKEPAINVVEQLKEEQKELTTLSAEYEELQAKVTCKICLDAKIESLFLPCRHLVCCENCANMVRECPFCRERIDGVVKVFL